MKYKIGKWGWSISQFVVPAGWIVNTDVPLDRMDHWSREIYQRGLQPPPDALVLAEPLEQENARWA